MIKRNLGRKKTKKTIELCMTPTLNLFIVLIPFLLLTATFVQTSVIDLFLPYGSQQTTPEPKEKEKVSQDTFLILCIAPKGFYLLASDRLLKIIPKDAEYDFDKLETALRKVKETFPERQTVIIESEDTVIYDHIIHVMDRCRACGLMNITLAVGRT
ncbi:MAG: biopolymer transporter ExbD [Pseudomonadota bacterium]